MKQSHDSVCCILQDYFEIVRHPMDLSTIKRKLDAGQYSNPWEVCVALPPPPFQCIFCVLLFKEKYTGNSKFLKGNVVFL